MALCTAEPTSLRSAGSEYMAATLWHRLPQSSARLLVTRKPVDHAPLLGEVLHPVIQEPGQHKAYDGAAGDNAK